MRHWYFRALGGLMALALLVATLAVPVGATFYAYPGQPVDIWDSFGGSYQQYWGFGDGTAAAWMSGSDLWGHEYGGWQSVPWWSGPFGDWSEDAPSYLDNYRSTIEWDYWMAAPLDPGTYSEPALYPGSYTWYGGGGWETLEVEPWPLSASASPRQLNQGQNLTISANTSSAPAISVTAATPGGNVALTAGSEGGWSVTVPASWAPGSYTINLTATYSGGSQSTAQVSVTVTQPPTVTGSLSPNPAKLGDAVAVSATTTGASFTAVTATDPDGTVRLTSQGTGKWTGQCLEDWAVSGTYPITLTAYIQGGGQVTSTVNLTISGTDVYVIPTNVW